MVNKEFISLAELGLEMTGPKSRLACWKKNGLIAPTQTIAKTDLYKYPEILNKVKKIIELQEKGLKLTEIKNRLN
jgi:DNA-binding transcriptional MerR regulator